MTSVAVALALALGQTGSFGAQFPPMGTAVGGKDAAGKMQPMPIAPGGGGMTVTPTAKATANQPSYVEGTVNPLSQNLNGNLRVAITQAVLIAPGNNSTANLDPGESFTGIAADTLGINGIQPNIKTDQPVTVHVQQSIDGVNWDVDDVYTLDANVGDGRTFQAVGAFVRVIVTNTGLARTTYFRLELVIAPIVEAVPRRLTNAGNLRVGIAEALPNSVSTGTITSTQDVSISASGLGNVRYAVTGTWTGTLYFESTIDGTNWIPTVGVPVPATILGGAVVASTTGNGNWESRAVAVQRFRVRGVVTSGTANITIVGNSATDFVIAGMLDDGIVFAGTTTPLGAGGVWQSPVIDMLPYVSETTSIYADVPSAVNGVVMEVSHDGATWFPDHSTTYTNHVAEAFTHSRKWRYSRMTYTNGATPQATFVIQIILQRASQQVRTAHFSEDLHADDTALLSRSVITGERTTVGNGYSNVTVNDQGALNVNTGNLVDSLTNANGLQTISDREVAVALLWPHGINARQVSTTVANGGTVTQNIVGGASVQNVILATSANAAGSAIMASLAAPRFTPQQSVRVLFSSPAFACVVGNQKWIGTGLPSPGLGYFFGCDPTTGTFGVMYRNSTGDHFTPRSAWNGYKLDGTTGQPTSEVFDPTKTNFYIIEYRMGAGLTQFFVQFPGKTPTLVHQMQWRNTATSSGVAEGFLPLHAENINVGSAANNTITVGPMVSLTEVGSDPVGVHWAHSNSKTVANGVFSNVWTLQNKSTWNGTGGPTPNRVRLRLHSLSLSAVGGGANGLATCDIMKSATLGGVPAYTDIDANNSIAAADVAGTTVTGGYNVFTMSIATGSAQAFDLAPYRLRLHPGETYTMSCAGDGAAVTVRVGASWVEEW